MVIGNTFVTLADVLRANRGDMYSKVVEVLSKSNPVVMDMPMVPYNSENHHKVIERADFGEVYYRKVNQAGVASHSRSVEKTFNSIPFESKIVMDEKAANRGGEHMINRNRWFQAQGHLQMMAQEWACNFFYGSSNQNNVQDIPGLSDYYYSRGTAKTQLGQNVVDFGSSTENVNTSVWLILWGDMSCYSIYRPGSAMGIKRVDRNSDGRKVPIIAPDQNGNLGHMWGYEEQFEVDSGPCLHDWRQVVRGPNIRVDSTGSVHEDHTSASIIDNLIKMRYRLQNVNNGRGVWYMGKAMLEKLHLAAREEVKNSTLKIEYVSGKPITFFEGFPIRQEDSLITKEALVKV